MKVCKKCKNEKPILEFGFRKSELDGLYPLCKACVKINNKNYKLKHKKEISEYNKNWNITNKTRKTAYVKRKLEENIYYKIAKYMRNRLYRAFNGNYKSGSAIRDLGCSIEDLKLWLEQQFESGMTWDNYGTYWSVDHIIPLSKFDLTDLKQLKKACHWFNLRPIKTEENSSRGNRI